MCFGRVCQKSSTVQPVVNTNGEILIEQNTNSFDNETLPSHVDNPLLNINLKTGVLGFRYETKTESFTVYSNVEAKTFCLLMGIEPVRKE